MVDPPPPHYEGHAGTLLFTQGPPEPKPMLGRAADSLLRQTDVLQKPLPA